MSSHAISAAAAIDRGRFSIASVVRVRAHGSCSIW